MSKYTIIPLASSLGIQRDGTPYFSKSYIDGQWVRFYEDQPVKIGGYQVIDAGTIQPVVDMFAVQRPNSINLYIGRGGVTNTFGGVSYTSIQYDGTASAEIDRTPTTGFTANDNNLWDFDLFTTSGEHISATGSQIVAQFAPNGNDISNTTEGGIFYGDVDSNAALVQCLDDAMSPVTVSGGIIFSSPVMVAYGNDGVIRWSKPGDVTEWPTDQFLVIANTKILKGYRTRAGGTPSLLFWSSNSLIKAYTTVTGDPQTVSFSSDTIEDDITLMSPDCIVKYNQMFFWIGTDQFYFYNGIVQKLDNTMNNDWFFNNVNLNARAQIWGMAVPRFKEIWWFYPRGSSTVCNACVIYNVQYSVWYDSTISRGAGIQTSIFPNPIMADSVLRTIPTRAGLFSTYPIWMHEVGYDRVEETGFSYAIPSYFETRQQDLWSSDPQTSNLTLNRRLALDFLQTGDMTITINNRFYPRDSAASDGPYTFTPTTPFLDFNSQGGIVSFVFTSNVVGGFYHGGKTLQFINVGDTLK